jgi:hypothetical protein
MYTYICVYILICMNMYLYNVSRYELIDIYVYIYRQNISKDSMMLSINIYIHIYI